MLRAARALTVIILLFSGHEIAAEETKPLTSEPARKAQARFHLEIKKLDLEYDQKRSQLKEVLLEALIEAKSAATKAEKLDEALRIEEEIAKLKALPAQTFSPQEQLRSVLSDSAWINTQSGAAVAFRGDSTIKASWHDEPGLWVVVGDKEVLAMMTKKRWINKLKFATDLQLFTDPEGHTYKRVK